MNICKSFFGSVALLLVLISYVNESFAYQCNSSERDNHSAQPHSLIAYPDNHNVIYDVENNRYWIRDVEFFTGYFEDKLQQISDLNNSPEYVSPYWSEWHMDDGNFYEIINGYCYDDSAEAFGYARGIIDERNIQRDIISTLEIPRPENASRLPNNTTNHIGVIDLGAWVTADPALPPRLSKVKVTIAPTSAVSGGAKWSIDGIIWHKSGESTWAFPSVYKLLYTQITGFAPPPDTKLNIKEGYDTEVTTTLAMRDDIPDRFMFTDVSTVSLGKRVVSNTITVTGINVPSPISISGGKYSINGGAYSLSSASVVCGDKVTVSVGSSKKLLATVNATLTIGGVSDTFSVITEPERFDLSITSFGCKSSQLNPLTGVTTVTQCMTIKNTGNVGVYRVKARAFFENQQAQKQSGITFANSNRELEWRWDNVIQPESTMQSRSDKSDKLFRYQVKRGYNGDLGRISWEICFHPLREDRAIGSGNDDDEKPICLVRKLSK